MINQKEETVMLNEKVVALLNDQINKEFYSAYLYLDFSNFFEDKGLEGFDPNEEEDDHHHDIPEED